MEKRVKVQDETYNTQEETPPYKGYDEDPEGEDRTMERKTIICMDTKTQLLQDINLHELRPGIERNY